MAEIFLARERGAGPEEFIVIKRLLGHISEHPGLVQMFLDEARVAATLNHPNIVKIYNVGTVGGHFFLSMEHLRGLDLSKLNREMRRQKRKLPIQHVLYICHRIAKALEYAHNHRGRKGERLSIVHRDLSPHNVFMTLDGEIKLLDFGVAKAANALHKTKTGALIGKLAYMSPEHLNNDVEIDGRSDLFSLGIIMWELSVGRRLYNTKKLGEFEVLRRITQEPVPDPLQFRSDYPEVVRDLLNRVLQKEREERFQTAGDLATAIVRVADSLGLSLTEMGISEFVNNSLPEVVERITSSIKQLERPSRAVSSLPYTPSLVSPMSPMSSPMSSPAQSHTDSSIDVGSGSGPEAGSGSGSGARSTPTASQLINSSPAIEVDFDEEDEERTERRIRRVQKATWSQLPQPLPRHETRSASRNPLPLVIALALLAMVVIGAIVLLAS